MHFYPRKSPCDRCRSEHYFYTTIEGLTHFLNTRNIIFYWFSMLWPNILDSHGTVPRNENPLDVQTVQSSIYAWSLEYYTKTHPILLCEVLKSPYMKSLQKSAVKTTGNGDWSHATVSKGCSNAWPCKETTRKWFIVMATFELQL